MVILVNLLILVYHVTCDMKVDYESERFLIEKYITL